LILLDRAILSARALRGRFAFAGNVLTTEVAKTTSGGPVLYVEFREDGSAINPGPWWAKTDQRKVRG
jgi:septal ring factor EnvC (AmiA/AmiB activator)